jgi:poly(A) polymerase
LRNLSLRAPQASREPLLGLAALCLNVTEDAQNLRERLRLSNSEERQLASLAEAFVCLHECEQPPTRQELLHLLFRFGRQAAEAALLLACAEARAEDMSQWQAAHRDMRDIRVPHLPVSGADFLNRGVPYGRAVGAALKDVQARWIAAGFPEDPAQIAGLIEAAASAAKGGGNGQT